MKNKFKALNHHMPMILSFFIPFLVMILVFIERGIFPFGDRSFLRTDLYHQYAPFFKEFLEKVKNGGSLFYSWNIGNGSNFLALYTYYLASPTNWLILLCPAKYVIEFITYSIVIKLSLSGYFMAYYLKKKTETNSYALPLFASFYALSGYMAAYSWNIMWLDCILLFPLIILGLERLVKEDKCLLYCITLALAIFSNYYISIMICIALVFYFIMLLVIEPGKTSYKTIDDKTGKPILRTCYMNYPKKVLEFGVYSLIAGALSAVLLLPATYALQMSASANSKFPALSSFTSYFSILEMLHRHLDNVDVHLGLEHWPNIFCGVAVLIFIPLYLLNRKVSAKEKAAYGVYVLFLLASFSMNFLNFLWHGYHYPNSLPCRQSFVYIFLILTMCYKGFLGVRERSSRQILGSICIAVLFVLFCEDQYAPDGWNFKVYYVSILFLVLYGILLYIYRRFPKTSVFLIIASILAVTGENYMNTSITSVTTINRTDYVKYDDSYTELVECAENNSALPFFRIEKLRLRTKNDGSWYQYPSMSVFSSTANANMSSFYKKLGMESATNAYPKTGATALIDMIFNVQYELSNITYPDNEIRKKISTSGDVKLYQNLYTLPLGFMVPENFDTAWYAEGSNPVDTQNNFISTATGLYSLFQYITVPASESTLSSSYIAETPGYYYAYVTNSSIDKATTSITRGDGSSSPAAVSHTSLKRRFILDIGYAFAGDTINVSIEDKDNQTLTYSLYRLDETVMKAAYEKLNAHGLDITEMNQSSLTGTVDAEENGILFTSIAYDKGWTVTVDGEKTEPVTIKDTLLGIPVSAGHHVITMKYVPEGFYTGLLISLGALLLLIVLCILHKILGPYQFPSLFIEDQPLESEPEAEEAQSTSDKTVSAPIRSASKNISADKNSVTPASFGKPLDEARISPSPAINKLPETEAAPADPASHINENASSEIAQDIIDYSITDDFNETDFPKEEETEKGSQLPRKKAIPKKH